VLGGCAHLLNFVGSDTMSAAFYCQYVLNNGKPVGTSVPATEHSVMTSWRSEKAAIENMIDRFGDHVFSCVMDTYDYTNALDKVIPSVYAKKLAKGGFMVLRPDSGDPIEVVLQGLRAAEKTAGSSTNTKGFKVIKGFSVLQGDGINLKALKEILKKVQEAGYSAENVTFGMGAGLLQKVNRDTMSFATKLSYIVYDNGEERDVMKCPTTDTGKRSLPGVLEVRVDANGIPVVYPKNPSTKPADNLLKVVYNRRPVPGVFEDFTTVRNRVQAEWSQRPAKANVISEELSKKMDKTMAAQKVRNEEALKDLS